MPHLLSDTPGSASLLDSDFVEPSSSCAADPDCCNDDYSQRGDLFRLMQPEEQERLFASAARRMAGVSWENKMRQICQFFRVDPRYGMGVAKALGFDISRFARVLAPAAAEQSAFA